MEISRVLHTSLLTPHMDNLFEFNKDIIYNLLIRILYMDGHISSP